jgi:hypothetical protein
MGIIDDIRSRYSKLKILAKKVNLFIQFGCLFILVATTINYLIGYAEFVKFKFTEKRVDSVYGTPCNKTINTTERNRFCGYVLLLNSTISFNNISKCSVLRNEQMFDLRSYMPGEFNRNMTLCFVMISIVFSFSMQIYTIFRLLRDIKETWVIKVLNLYGKWYSFPAFFVLQAVVNLNRIEENCVRLSPKFADIGAAGVGLIMLIPGIIILVTCCLPLAFVLDKFNIKEMNPNNNLVCFCILGCEKFLLLGLMSLSLIFEFCTLGAALFMYFKSFLGIVADVVSNVAMIFSGVFGMIYLSSR